MAISNGLKLCLQLTAYKTQIPSGVWPRNFKRNHISTLDVLDPVYKPAFVVDSCYESYFKPTFVSDKNGILDEKLRDDLMSAIPCI